MGYPLSRFITRGENKPYLISRLRKRVDQALIPISTIQKFQLSTLNIVGRNEMLLLLLSPLSHHLSNNVDQSYFLFGCRPAQSNRKVFVLQKPFSRKLPVGPLLSFPSIIFCYRENLTQFANDLGLMMLPRLVFILFILPRYISALFFGRFFSLFGPDPRLQVYQILDSK